VDSRIGFAVGAAGVVKPRGIRPLVRLHGVVLHGEPCYCLGCGSQDGFVTTELPPGVFYLCGNCEQKYGVPEEFHRRPDIARAT
jgi:hypothetical protein